MSKLDHVAQEGEEFGFCDRQGQDIVISWHPPEPGAPAGTNHGAGGICFTPEGKIVLVTWPGFAWDFPAGRPEAGEDWRATRDREVFEEACAVVEEATLLGFSRAVHAWALCPRTASAVPPAAGRRRSRGSAQGPSPSRWGVALSPGCSSGCRARASSVPHGPLRGGVLWAQFRAMMGLCGGASRWGARCVAVRRVGPGGSFDVYRVNVEA